MDTDFKSKLFKLFEFHSCLSNGICDRDGYYVPIVDAINNDFTTNRKRYREGDEFPDHNPWIRVPEEIGAYSE
ncbi:hypothetical protein Lbir_2682 [Legionella birminghamensis]|uniref:Uncharacterized protein n=1 Tax=Legionella birminghamensis TaxID=28083 RepID=A0A378I8Z7_9GAMM|nr:hypothetical protein [Legionella birminghamensis]KTC68080.1 hypothetical protein Lbir_2682 [Legionella birminghamensis]STX31210.1 Uncharacterised protein [Legionella birminghamensis]